MSKNNKIINDIIKKIGVKNPKKPTAKEIKLILDAYLRTKELDTEIFNNYLKMVNPALNIIFDGLKQFSEDQSKTSEKTLNIIKTAMHILGEELQKENLKPKEKSDLRNKLIELVNDAREESKENKAFLIKCGLIGLGAVTIIAGGVLFVVTKGKSKTVIVKGVQTIGRAVKL